MKHLSLTITMVCLILILASGQVNATVPVDSSGITNLPIGSPLVLSGIPMNSLPEPATLLILCSGAIMTSRVKFR
jgi:hypothetical protein